MFRHGIVVILGVLLSHVAAAIPTALCLNAKSKFAACAQLARIQNLSTLSCLDADSGYPDCRTAEGDGSHERCLATKGQYKQCRDLGLDHFSCARADSGFLDCVIYERDPLLCLGVKGGYKACRLDASAHTHTECAAADSGYADCRATGGSHVQCINARRSFKHCSVADHQSVPFCLTIGKGYMECRQAGYPIGTCVRADHGFKDCAAFQ